MKIGKCLILLLLLGILTGCSNNTPELIPEVINNPEPIQTTDTGQPDELIPIISQATEGFVSSPSPEPTILPTSFYQVDSQFKLLPAGFYLTFFDLESNTLEALSFQLTQRTIAKSDSFSSHSNNSRFALNNNTLINLETKTSMHFPDLGLPNCEIPSISVSGAVLVANCEKHGIFISREGSDWVNVFDVDSSVEYPLLSPDDQQIVFCINESNENIGSGIYRLSINECLQYGECKVTLTSTNCDNALYAWSPDAKMIAVAKQDQGIYLIDLATASRIELLTAQQVQTIENMVWSPDGQWIAYSVLQDKEGNFNTAIYLINIKATEPRLFFESDHKIQFVGWLNIISPFKSGKHYLVLPSETSLWLKDKPDPTAFNLKLFVPEERLIVLDKSELVNGELWWQVRVGDYSGWVKEDPLHFQDDWMYGLNSPVFEPGSRLIVKRSGNDLRLRAMPSLNGAVKRHLLPGTRLKIVDGPAVVDYFNWWLVEIEESKIYGWVVEEALWYASD